jgi:putative nucleotidyltransferase with HDIG domain
MAEQSANGREKGVAPGSRGKFDFRLFMKSLSWGKYLPLVYLLVFLVISLFLFPPMQQVKDVRFREGDIADVDVIAPFDFFVPLSEQEIEENRTNAAARIPPVYKEKSVAELLPSDMKTFMEGIASVAALDTLSDSEKVDQIKAIAPIMKNDPVELLLAGRTRDRILQEGLKIQKELLERGIINDASPLRRGNYPRITVTTSADERMVQSRPLIEQGELEAIILSAAKNAFGKDERSIKLFYSIVRSHLMPNLIFDMDETKRRRDDAERDVPKSFKVSDNQRIIAKHDKITKRQVAMLEALEQRKLDLELETSVWKRFFLVISKALRIMVLLLLLGLSLHRLRRDLVIEPDKLTLIFIILLMYLLLVGLVVKISFLSPYLVPVAFVSLLATAFFGVMTAVMFTLFASLLIVTHTDLPASYAFISILAGTAAIISITHLRERRNFYKIFLYVSLAYIIGITSFGAAEGITVRDFLTGTMWGITNGFICTILVMFLMPIFESLFDVTTNFTLMELSDLNRPLLRRLIMEAPGTYHHSLMVGNMVEAVASDVGANSLLARVAAYYHDIGKLAKPEYFFENKGDNINKHEKLTPTMSALILSSHVKEGIDLAKKEKLPKVVIEAIREHHGTTVMAYFYQKALEYDSHDSVNIDDFRYDGPRPHSKEIALIMLADSCEAAVRSLKEPSAPRIRAVVKRLFEARMNDGELDNSGLTLKDIAVVREKFIKFLTGIFHPRISYPKQEAKEDKRGQLRETGNKQPAQSERKGRV